MLALRKWRRRTRRAGPGDMEQSECGAALPAPIVSSELRTSAIDAAASNMVLGYHRHANWPQNDKLLQSRCQVQLHESMARLHTHYDNLKVARDAPPEVIKAAYRALAQRYHPDVNSSEDAVRIMKVINTAYAVLSDPSARQKHDKWIEEQLVREAIDEASVHSDHPNRGTGKTGSTASRHSWPEDHPTNSKATPSNQDRLKNHRLTDLRRTALGACLLIAIFAVASLRTSKPAPPYVPPTSAAPTPALQPLQATSPIESSTRQEPIPLSRERAIDDRFKWSPNGKPWPDAANYIKAMPSRAWGGLSKLTIDNTSGGSDVYVKLCHPSSGRCEGLRHVFIPLGSQFTMAKIASGTYEVRYRSLDTGSLARSEPITLREVAESGGIRFSVVKLTLYRVYGGNTSFTSLDENEF